MTQSRTHDLGARELSGSNARLVRECLNGNEAAWSALVDRFKNLVFSIALRYGLSPDDAADVFQAVFLELLSELPRLRDPQALPAWLMRVTYHKCFHLKREQHGYVTNEAQETEPRSERETQEMPEELVRENEQEQMLREALSELSPRCRQLVRMLFFESPTRPYREVARSLGVATGSIGFIRGRCLEHLRKSLEKLGFR